jgi:hypothetical protein
MRIAATTGAFGIVFAFCTSMVAQPGPPQQRDATIFPMTPARCNDMKLHRVIKPGAPVGCERLREVKFGYFGFDGQTHVDGEVVVLDAVAGHVLQIFETLRRRQFPIAKARSMDLYNGDDEASMSDNNTSAFNDRAIAGGGRISIHAFGLAIDINPIQNPYVRRTDRVLSFSPKAGIAYVDRTNLRPGMAEAIIDVFSDHGFNIWGGDWHNPKDYQHFQVSRDLAYQLARASSSVAASLFEHELNEYQACIGASTIRKNSDRKSCTHGGP